MNRKRILLTLIVLVTVAAFVMPVAAQQYITYVTQEGDSLSKIAAQFCTTWQAIYEINYGTIGPDPNKLEPGMSLTIPAYCNNPQPTPPPSSGVYDHGPQTYATGYVIPPNIYVVNWGDTLTSIAERFGVTVTSIIDANNIATPNRIWPGQQLIIPGLNGSSTAPPPSYTPKTVYINEFTNGGTVDLFVNDVLVVSLPADITGGYTWTLPPNTSFSTLIFKSGPTNILGGSVGDPEKQEFTFNAVVPGQDILRLDYLPPDRGAPVNVYQVNVVVQ